MEPSRWFFVTRTLKVESEDGSQWPVISVFTRGADGRIVHRYSGNAIIDDAHARGLDLLSPVWNLLDLTPEGRGDWMPKRSYDT